MNDTATPLSEDIGTLCAGLVATADNMDERGSLIEVGNQEVLESLLSQYGTTLYGNDDADVEQQA